MPLTPRNLESWGEMNIDEFRKVYESEAYRAFISYLEKRLKSDLIRIIASTGTGGRVFFTGRVKDALSAHKKMLEVVSKWKKSRASPPTPVLHELLQDIIGFRVICLDNKSMEDIIRRLNQSTFISIQITKGSTIYNRDKVAARRLQAIHSPHQRRNIQIHTKVSGYEGINYQIRFSSPMAAHMAGANSLGRIFSDRIKQIIELRKVLNEGCVECIQQYPIELQVRTFTQHIWASEEHQKIYKTKLLQSGNGDLTRGFKELAVRLKAVDKTIEQIRLAYCKDTIRTLRFSGKSYQLGLRAKYFSGRKFDDIRAELEGINNAIQLDGRPSGTTCREKMTDIVSLSSQLKTICNSNPFEHSDGLDKDDAWGRNRIILMVAGYLFLFCPKDKRTSLLSYLHETTSIGEILKWQGLSKIGNEVAENAAATLYEYILKRDQLSAGQNNHGSLTVFHDPLIYSRLATCHYQNEDFVGAVSKLSELFSLPWWPLFWEQQNKGMLDVPKKFQFYLRRGEYYWHAFSCGDAEDPGRYLRSALDDLVKCFECEGATKDIKVLAWSIVVVSILEIQGFDNGSLLKVLNPHVKKFHSLLEEERNKKKWDDKPYVKIASSILFFNGTNHKQAIPLLEQARKKLRSGIAHPRHAIEQWLFMCDVIELNMKEPSGFKFPKFS